MSLHPDIVDLTDRLFPEAGRVLFENPEMGLMDLHRHFYNQQQQNPEEYKKLTFRMGIGPCGSPYSYQLEYVINNWLRRGLVEQVGNEIRLSEYGKKETGK